MELLKSFLKGLLGHNRAERIAYFVEQNKPFIWGVIVALAVVCVLF